MQPHMQYALIWLPAMHVLCSASQISPGNAPLVRVVGRC